MKFMIKIIVISTFLLYFEVCNLNPQTKIKPKEIFSNFIINKYMSSVNKGSIDMYKNRYPLIPKIFEPKITELLFEDLSIYYYEGFLEFTNKNIDTSGQVNNLKKQTSEPKYPAITQLNGIITKDTLHYAVTQNGELYNLNSINDLRQLYKLIYQKEDFIKIATKFAKLLFYSQFRYFSFMPEKFDFNTYSLKGSIYGVQVCDSLAKPEFLKQSTLIIEFKNDSILEINVRKPTIIWEKYK